MKDKIKEIIKLVFQLDSVSNDISQLNCEKWDSLNHLNLIVELENEFDISLEPEEIVTMKDLEIITQIVIEKKEK
jgi:acyl carrier protein